MAAMNDLPTEILTTLCSYFSVEELETILAKISRQWEAVATVAINHRVSTLNRFISPEARLEVKTYFIPPDPTALELVKKYESTNCTAKFKVMEFLYEQDSRKLAELFYLLMGVDEMEDNFTTTLYNVIKFIPAYNLVMLLAENNTYFIHEKDFFTVGSSLEPIILMQHPLNPGAVLDDIRSPYTYTVESSDAFRPFSHNHPSARVALIDAYHENVVICPRNLRTPCFYNIGQVSHTNKSITMNLIRQVFLPFTFSALRIYRLRLVMVFSTGFVGIWRVAPNPLAELVISVRKVSGDAADAQMFRIHNWMIIKSGPSFYDVVDGARDEVELKQIPLLDLLATVLRLQRPYIYKEVDKVELSGNLLLVKARGLRKVPMIDEDSGDSDDEETENILCVLKLKRAPTILDFLTVDNFKNLVDQDDSEVYVVASNFFLLLPSLGIIPEGPSDLRIKATLLMMNDDEEDVSSIYHLLESHRLLHRLTTTDDPKQIPVVPAEKFQNISY